ncbi:MAG: class I SAM-dependent methyltransferase [Myxococcota bacterium]
MLLRRYHWIEIADQSGCPRLLRDGLTDYLRHAEATMRPYDPAVPRLKRAFDASGAQRVLDLCSGAGGPWLPLLDSWEKLGAAPAEVRLTDQRPSPAAWARATDASRGRLRAHPEPIDARAVPKELDGFRTLFAAFHHFRPAQAEAILRDAVEKRQGIAILEVTERSWRAVALACFSWLFVMLLTPGIRPVSLRRLVLTYLIPVIPLLITFDGVVSCLRTYTPEELAELARRAGGDHVWEIGQANYPGFPIPVTWLIGVPRDASA